MFTDPFKVFLGPRYRSEDMPDGFNVIALGVLSGVPVIGDFLRTYENYRYYDDYLRNSGMTWDDIKYPVRTLSGLSGIYGGINYISRNINRLYD